MIIRKAKPEDIDAVYAFINDLENTVFNKRKFKRIYLESLKNKNNIHLIAFDGVALGYISCHIQMLLHHCGPIAEIQELFVVSTERSKGIGKLLVDELKRILKKKGVPQIEVTSRLHRTEAHKFYEKESFAWTHKKLIFKVSDN